MTEDKLTDFEKIADFGALYQAYKRSKAGKGYSNSSMKFQLSALDGIYRLKNSLENKTYTISPYNQFKVYEPKERIIKACSFQDKIVQHSLCDNVLLPNLKDEFVYDNYAGQIGKGTLFGLNRLSEQMLQAYNEYGIDCWNIKADISKFFYSIDHNILKDMVRYHIDDNDVYWLCEKFIDSTEGIGIPLGNQVSQVFALLYLSGLDHFIKDDLGAKYYGRYVDDFYILGLTKEQAKEYLEYVSVFVSSLNLTLNGKTQIIPFKNGIKFCGFHTYVTNEGQVIRKLKNENKRVAKKKFKNLAELVRQGELSEEKFYQKYNAWKNYISHGNCYKLGVEMDKYVQIWLKGEECKMKVIFLDIDGVLNNQQTFQSRYKHHQSTGEWLLEIDEAMVKRLANIVNETNAEIVLSSSWRTGFSYDTCEPQGERAQSLVDILNKYGLSIYSRTGHGRNRADEIEEWLRNHEDINSFVILDDDSYDLQKFVGKELVKTSLTAPNEMIRDMSDCTGLQDEHVIKAINILNKTEC